MVAAAAGSKEVYTALKNFMNITGSVPASDLLTHKSCSHCWILFCHAQSLKQEAGGLKHIVIRFTPKIMVRCCNAVRDQLTGLYSVKSVLNAVCHGAELWEEARSGSRRQHSHHAVGRLCGCARGVRCLGRTGCLEGLPATAGGLHHLVLLLNNDSDPSCSTCHATLHEGSKTLHPLSVNSAMVHVAQEIR